MFKQVSKRSMCDMSELRSENQKMMRYAGLLPGGWLQFHWTVDEYLCTLIATPSTLLLFVTKDCARCHPYVLREIIQLMKTKKAQVDPWRTIECLKIWPINP